MPRTGKTIGLLPILALLSVAMAARAQSLPDAAGISRPPPPGPNPPGFASPEPAIGFPAAPFGAPADRDGPLTVTVREIVLRGVTVLDQRDIAAVTAGYLDRTVAAEELYELAYQLTQLYVRNGYVTSGVVLPDQEIVAGRIVFQAVEGQLDGIEISNPGRLDATRLRGRIRRNIAGGILRLDRLQEAIALARQDGLIEQINAEIAPGAGPGKALLRLGIREADPLQFGLSIGNARSPSVGALRSEAFLIHRNVSGFADRLEARLGHTRGSHDHILAYTLPVAADDTAVAVRHSRTLSRVVEPPLDALDIQAETTAQSVGMTHPLIATTGQQLAAGLALETKSTRTLLLGTPFSFSAGIPDGRSRLSIWRASLDWSRRSSTEVLFARLALNSGTSNTETPKSGSGPDRGFFYSLLQTQWARQLSAAGNQLIARFDVQATRNALLASERFGLGGAGTVRGLRENQLLRDRGLLASVEYRHTIMEDDPVAGRLQLAAFVDHGRSGNADGSTSSPKSVSSAGLGVLASPGRHLSTQVYLARASHRFAAASRDLQDRGIHFTATIQY